MNGSDDGVTLMTTRRYKWMNEWMILVALFTYLTLGIFFSNYEKVDGGNDVLSNTDTCKVFVLVIQDARWYS